ncbi:MAG: hypothetical protein ACI8WY_004063 [Planctomycetota bacterium]|jgi:hypothetical protein
MGGMARLILEESGNTRRFKLSQGKLTFGSGEKATLTLASEDVAALHGQIEMGEDGAVLHIAKGVMPPQVAGRPVQGGHVMREGEVVTIGSSKFSVEYDEGEGPAGAAAPGPVTRPAARSGSARSGSRSGGSRRGGSSSARRSGGRSEEDGERPRPTRKSTGMPGWLIGGLVLLGILGLGYMVIASTASTMGDDVFDFDVRFSQYERIKDEDPGAARSDLYKIKDQELTAAQREIVDNEFELLSDRLAGLDDTARNSEISVYLKMRILDYFESRPVTEDRSYARLFLKRANDFVTDYPTHQEVEKVKRYIRRATPVAKLEEPAIFKDLEVEVTGFTGAKPMNFPIAFGAIDKFIAETSDPDETAKAEKLRAETEQVELEFYEAQLDDAAIVYDKGKYPDKYSPNQAMQDMVVIITSVNNPDFKDDAAKRITLIKEMNASYLRGYKRGRPDAWDQMMKMPLLREFAIANGLEE